MERWILAFALAARTLLAPATLLAQDFSLGTPNAGGIIPSPGNFAFGGNVNPFASAAGADRYFHDNTSAGVSQPNMLGNSGQSGPLDNFIGGNTAGTGSGLSTGLSTGLPGAGTPGAMGGGGF